MEFGTGKIGHIKSSYLGLKQGKGLRKCATHHPPGFHSLHLSLGSISNCFGSAVSSSEPSVGQGKWTHKIAGNGVQPNSSQDCSDCASLYFEGRSLVEKMTSCLVYDRHIYNTDETDVLAGEPCPSQVGNDYRLTSGNRILHSARHSDQGQQLILG